MTILEQNYMNSMPAILRDIRDSVKEAVKNSCPSRIPLIKYSDNSGFTYIEQFNRMYTFNEDGRYIYRINSNSVPKEEYERIEAIISKHL